MAKASKTLTDLNDENMKYVKIFIDSQAAISAIGNPLVTSRVVVQAIPISVEHAGGVSPISYTRLDPGTQGS